MSSEPSELSLFSEGEGGSPRKVPTFGQSLLALNDIKGLGRKGLRALVTEFADDLGEVWESDPKRLQKVLEGTKVPSAEKVAEEITARPIPHLAAGLHTLRELVRRSTAMAISVGAPISWSVTRPPTRC